MVDAIIAYIPLSIIGIWRWSYWLVRVVGAGLYKVQTKNVAEATKRLTISVVTPVYNEDPQIFRDALDSWIANEVDEIVAVIDQTNVAAIVEYERDYVRGPQKTHCRIVVTPKPGKRAALCDGINRAKGDIIALVDSDTTWSVGVAAKVTPYFANNPAIGGVTVPQRISNPNTLSNVLFDILLWDRYNTEVPFLMGLGGVFNTLSGRTAFYKREALVNNMYDNLHHLRHEFFLGTRGISGDDKRLSHLILEQGYQVAYAPTATVYTTGMDKISLFLKQRLRWTRNSWRADLRAIKRKWIWQYPVLAYFMIDRFIQPFFMLLGPIAFTIALTNGRWLAAGVLAGWWVASRFIKLFGYFRRHPLRLIYIPAYIIYSYLNALLKIYALATVIEHSWVTRWNKSRNKKGFSKKVFVVASGTVGVILVLFSIFTYAKKLAKSAAVDIPRPAAISAGEFVIPPSVLSKVGKGDPAVTATVAPTQVKIYTAEQNDTLISIGEKLGVDYQTLKKLNNISDPDKLNPGQPILYYVLPDTTN